MSRNGSGTYAAPASSWNPPVADTQISTTDWIALLADLSTALSASVANDGQTVCSAVIPFAASLSTASFVRFPAVRVASAGANDLDDYEEGTFTPADGSGASLSLTINNTPWYKKVGSLVIAHFSVTYPVTANASGIVISGLPFVTVQSGSGDGAHVTYSDKGALLYALIQNSASTVSLYAWDGIQITNANMSGKRVDITAIYNAG